MGPDMTAAQTVSGMVFDVQRFSIHDGPGIRTTVFLKGCPLCCDWCHNPESWSRESELSFDPSRCLMCGACVAACPAGAHSLDGGEHKVKREACTACGECVESCPSRALELCGREMSVSDVLKVVERDVSFYRESGGGLTISGGEPLMQAEFSACLLARARDAGIHTAMETSGCGTSGQLESVAGACDLVLFDVKAAPADYPGLTGGAYSTVEARLDDVAEKGIPVWLRLPLVPGINDTDPHFANIARLTATYSCIERVEILPFHAMSSVKRARFGLAAQNPAFRPPEPELTAKWSANLRKRGVPLVE